MESETTLWFDSENRLTAFRRTKHSVPGHILEASPPYTTWKTRPADVHLSGHCVHDFDGVTYLLSRMMDSKGRNTGTVIYTYQNGVLNPYATLPSGGDCSYAEAIQKDGNMLISYYSSHEDSTNIYLAVVPLPTQAPTQDDRRGRP